MLTWNQIFENVFFDRINLNSTLYHLFFVSNLKGLKIRGWSKIRGTRFRAKLFIPKRFDRESFVRICTTFYFISIFLFVPWGNPICCTVKIVSCRTVAIIQDNPKVQTGSVFKLLLPVCSTKKFVCHREIRLYLGVRYINSTIKIVSCRM